MNPYILRIPQKVYSGAQALKYLSHVVKGYKRAIVFADAGIVSIGLIDTVLAQLMQDGIEYAVISDVPNEPTYLQAQKAIDQFHSLQGDIIIGVGGGSVMDIAKLASIVEKEGVTVKELLEDPSKGKKCTACVLIPTTAGTGAEATPNSIVAVPEKQTKVGIVCDARRARNSF